MADGIQLRPYQREALDKTFAAEARGVRAQMGVAATGLGKTVMFTSLAKERGGRTLILAHRDELITQAVAQVREVWPDADVGVVKADRNEVDAQVVVASVQTLSRGVRIESLLAPRESLLRPDFEPFGMVVIDEAHHAAAPTYREIIDRLGAGKKCGGCGGDGVFENDCGMGMTEYLGCPDCEGGDNPCEPLLIGVTATPDRGDGEGLDEIFDEIVWSYDLLWGIRAGFLADVRGLRVQIPKLDLSTIKVSRGDYQVGSAGAALLAADGPAEIVEAWQKYASDRRTLVFTPTVAAAEAVMLKFQEQDVQASMVSGELDTDERRARLKAYADGELQVMVNCMVLTEGYDNPRTDCIVVARPTKSRALYTQMVGRGTRRHPEKTDLLVLDVVGVTEAHSLVTVPSLFGIPNDFEGIEMMGDGSGLATDVLDDFDQMLVRMGQMKAETAELFKKLRGEGIAWVPVAAAVGREPELYVCGLGDVGTLRFSISSIDPALAGLDGPAWRAWVELADNTTTVLIDGTTMQMAQGVAEDYARNHGPRGLTDAAAKWRGIKPSDKQLKFARSLKIEGANQMTKGELSDAITAVLEARKLKRSQT